MIKESTWELANSHTWNDLSDNRWNDFYLVLIKTDGQVSVNSVVVENVGASYETESSMKVQGVAIEYSSIVMKTKSKMIVDVVASDRHYLSNMLQYLPLYERKSGTFIEILNAYGYQFVDAENQLNVVNRNQFIDMAIESLLLHERDLAIIPSSKLDYRQRREQIASRYRAAVDQTTEGSIKRVAESFSNGEVDIYTTETPGLFEVKFVGNIGIPDNMEALKKALDIIIPAHLGLTYKYVYSTWNNVSGNTWSDISNITWQGLREWDEVISA